MTLSSDVRAALERFKADQIDMTYEEAIEAALRDFLIGHGYLKIEEIEVEAVPDTSSGTDPA